MGRAERARWKGIDDCRTLLEESRSRSLTPDEVDELRRKYTGYGGLSSWNTDQHFTPPVVVRFMIDLLGIKDGDVFEPSCGAGGFIQELPEACRVTGIELMVEAAEVARICNPAAEIIQGDALERIDEVDGKYDWVIGNPPFSSFNKSQAPESYRIGPMSNRLEWYFVELGYHALKPGGMMALVVPEGILSNSRDQKARHWFLENAWLRAVISLPNETFAFSGTGVKTSVLVIQKPLRGYTLAHEEYQIFMVMAEDIGWDSRRRETGKNDLPKILEEAKKFPLNAIPLAKPYISMAPKTEAAETPQLIEEQATPPVEPLFNQHGQMFLF